MQRPTLVISIIQFDAEEIAKALRISPKEAVEALRDGRGAWPFSELWGARLYEFIKHSNTNKPVSDGAVALEQLRDVKISIKALTRGGIKFQQSKFVGFGRSTDRDGLVGSLEGCDRVVVVDITGFPTVRFLPLDTTRLVSAVYKDRLTTNGWSRDVLYRWLGETYDVSETLLQI